MSSSVFEKPFACIPFYPGLRVRLMGSEPFFGPGVAHLLELIPAAGSVAGACEKMGLSYSKGRLMVRRMERELGFRVVERVQGGAGGGGARLTEPGLAFLRAYQSYEQDVNAYAQARFAGAFAGFLPADEEEAP